MTYTITKNEQFNSLEINFDGKPSEAVRDALKALKFRWHGVKKIWYGYTDEETARKAIDGKPIQQPQKKAEKVNKYGVKVGDFFSASWGYEQTNVDFFQVVALVGESSVRVREVNPPIVSTDPVSSMAENRVYTLDTSVILPPIRRSCFIKDQENGDLKRLKSYAADGKSNPQFYLASYTDAHYCPNETAKKYVSWYY